MINWKLKTKEEKTLITQIIDRAEKLGLCGDRVDAEMDIIATHLNGCPLDLAKLLGAPDFTFAHDVNGISRHINRDTGKITRGFLPRCHATN